MSVPQGFDVGLAAAMAPSPVFDLLPYYREFLEVDVPREYRQKMQECLTHYEARNDYDTLYRREPSRRLVRT